MCSSISKWDLMSRNQFCLSCCCATFFWCPVLCCILITQGRPRPGCRLQNSVPCTPLPRHHTPHRTYFAHNTKQLCGSRRHSIKSTAGCVHSLGTSGQNSCLGFGMHFPHCLGRSHLSGTLCLLDPVK